MFKAIHVQAEGKETCDHIEMGLSQSEEKKMYDDWGKIKGCLHFYIK